MSASPPGARRIRRWAALSLVSIGLVAASIPPVAGQETPGSSEVDLRLVEQAVWHRPTDPLGIRLRIVNRGGSPVEGFLVSLTAHPLARTRSALQESFEGNAGAITSATSKTFNDVIDPGGALTIDLDDDVDVPGSLTGVSEGGAYPLTISLSDATGVIPYDSLTTPLILYPSRPEVPLNLALVLPLNDLPSRGPDGVFRDPLGSEAVPLEEAASADGWLTGLAAALEAHAGELPNLERTVTVHVPRRKNRRARTRTRTVSIPQRGLRLGIAPTPRLMEELADLSDGYRRSAPGGPRSVPEDDPTADRASDLLAALRAITQEDGLQTLLVPYSFPDMPALARSAPDRLELELEQGIEVLTETLDEEPSPSWLFAPAGRLGGQSLEELRFEDAAVAEHTLFEPDSFEVPVTVTAPGCPEAFASFACPVSVRTAAGPTIGLVADQGLQDRFVDLVQRDGGRLELQNLFAETATIRQELPSVEDRIVQVTVPSMWHPEPALAEALLAGLRDAPWLRTVTPAEGVELGQPQPRNDTFVEIFAPLSTDPGEALFEEIDETTDFIDDFRRMGPPESLVERLRRNTLVAESRIWWTGTALAAAGRDYLSRSEEIAEEEIAKVTVVGPDEINLTSQKGEIPLVIANRTGFPTTVRVAMRSPERDLVLDPEEIPAQRIEAGGSFQFTVEATARSSGIFQMEVLVDTPRGELEIASRSITIRSTAFNLIALGLTVGALVFLVVFYVMRLLRRRRDGST